MENNITAPLLRRYFAGYCSATEEARIERWLHADPENTQKAMQWLETFSAEEEALFTHLQEARKEVWENTAGKLPDTAARHLWRSTPGKNNTRRRETQRTWLRVAAAVSGLALLTFVSQSPWRNRQVKEAAAFGQVNHFMLPDSSLVELNGNSSLSYNRNWEGHDREVWLDGEAFFKVTHLKNNKRFIVHLSDSLRVEVLGTEFLVSDRKSHSSIVLKSGKVKVDLQADTAKSSIYLKPGELAEVRKGKTGAGYLTKSQVNPELYYSWTQGKWRLEGTSLGEMLLKLQDTYGINTVVENKNLLQRRASGSIPLEQGSATVLLTDIATLFELKVTEKKDGIYLEAKH